MGETKRWLRNRDENGAVAIIVAFSMLALLIVGGIAIDIGQARTDKLTNRTYTDAAAMAGIRATETGDGTVKPFVGACAALDFLRVSDPDLSTPTGVWQFGNGQQVVGDPCAKDATQQSTTCVANNPATWATFAGIQAGVSVTIKSGYLTPDPAYDPPGSGDNSAKGGCDQLAVIITQAEQPTLGRAASDRAIVTSARSVARSVAGSNQNASAPALLLLERDGCSVLSAGGNAQVQVYGTASTGGSIQADSLGDACGYKGKIYYADGNAMITAHRSDDAGNPGLITTTALSGAPGAVPANASVGPPKVCAQSLPTGCADATGLGVVGRGVVDRRYLSGVQSAEASAALQYNKVSGFGSTSAGVAYTVVGCSLQSNAAVAIFVDCPTGATLSGTGTVSFPNATDVVVNGSLTLSGKATLSLPKVNRLSVKGGAVTGLTVGGTASLSVGGSGSCAGQAGAASTAMVIGNGGFLDSGNGIVRLCNTTLLLADNTSNSCPDPSSTSGVGQAPFDNVCAGSVAVTGAGSVDWTAPDQYSGKPPTWNGLEDLALWTETSTGNSMSSSSNLSVTGVFFLPNANPLQIGGNASQTGGADAQFIARRIAVNGNGSLYLRPDPNDTVTVAPPSDYQLVR